MKLLIILIFIYQKIISPTIRNILGVNNICRFSPSCSEYAKRSISNYGVIKGSKMSIVRLLSCQPFYKF